MSVPVSRRRFLRSSTAAGSVPGKLITVPIRLDESTHTLEVNADAAAGRIRVEVRDAKAGSVFPGLSLAECEPIVADGLRQPVRWRTGKLSDLAGKAVQLEFEITGADLFAFGFRP